MNRNKIIKITSIIIVTLVIIIGGIFLYSKINKKNEPEIVVEKEKVTPLLYEVTKEGSNNKMYLFGSIHVANVSDFEFPKYVMDAYNNSHYLACEFDIIAFQNDQEKVLEQVTGLLYQDGTTIKDHLDKDAYEKLVNFLKEKNNYNELYEQYKPAFLESIITMQMAKDANININEGIDDYFLMKAKEDKKNILEVESADFQFNLSNNFSDKLYSLMFEEAVDEYDESIKGLKDLYQAWKDGNEELLLKTLDDDMDIKKEYTKEEIKLIEDYNKKMLDDRNDGMTKKAIEYFNNDQDVFFMVGAAHIITDTGLVNSLQENGFTVKQIKEA